MIGSHNTMTYLPVKQWYFKPLFWAARCQSKPLWEQFCYGARVFDIRIRFDKHNGPVFAHGPIEFKGNVFQVVEDLNSWCQNAKSYVRIILESNSEMKDQTLQEELFISFCKTLQEGYTNLIFFGGNRKYDWKVVYDFGTKEPTLDDKYSSTTGSKIDDIWPWLYARLNNKKNIQKGTDKDVLFIDFIGATWNK